MSTPQPIPTPHPASSPNSHEPIPGYRLLERLGRGGYGEVWKTLAPGGVSKAIKLIYGDDPQRLLTEQKALNRIKDVRHPFLLSIERIEQQGELLAIVTELADRNLQQYFNECRARELPGIPQNELLSMMRDVADVLDYIYQEHALQHLDVKPANLLLFGRRLKVGDFGLVKNIYERSASLVHGLTPTYASPEVFEGQPSRSSDQYSLAVLYQEMLTGCPPFNGATAARLATQHLREAPDLSGLPPAQRPVIARALSKDPQQRFATMSEMVEELVKAANDPVRSALPADAPASARNAPTAGRDSTPVNAVGRPSSVAPASESGHATTNPAAPADGPLIVIGIGGSAGKILQRLRIRIADRQQTKEGPGLPRLLFLDLDNDSLNELNKEQSDLCPVETVPTLLQTSAAYREQGNVHRRWLSRRWLFNVPRSLKTEGLRPLGRLALLSNSKRVLESLQAAIRSAVSECPNQTPRVILVASISGGTGSGMLIDAAYAMRHELAKAGFRDAPVDGLFVHSTPLGSGRDMARLNAIATLREIAHFSSDGGFYPGEPIVGVPSFHGNNRTFAASQLVDLGDELGTNEWLRGVDNVAELLYCRLFTDLDSTRRKQPLKGISGSSPIELVQVQQIGGYAGTFVDELTRQIGADIIDQWCDSTAAEPRGDSATLSNATVVQKTLQQLRHPRAQELTSEAEKRLEASGVDVEQLVDQARTRLKQELGLPEVDFLQSLYTDAVAAVEGTTPDHELATLVITLQDRAIGLDFGQRPNDSARNTLFDRLYPRLMSLGMPIAAKFLGWVCEQIDSPTGGVEAARQAAEAGRNCIRDLIGVVGKSMLDWQTEQTNARIRLTSPPAEGQSAKAGRGWLFRKPDTRAALAEQLLEHGRSSFEELLLLLVQWQLRSIEASISAVIDELLGMWHELKQLGKRLSADGAAPTTGLIHTSAFEDALKSRLAEIRPQLVAELRTRIESQVLTGPRKLQRLLQNRGTYDKLLGGPMQRLARMVVLDSINQLLGSALQRTPAPSGDSMPSIGPSIRSAFETPWTVDSNNPSLAMLIAPSEAKCRQFADPSSIGNQSIPVIPAKTNNVATYRELRGVTFPALIDSLAGGNRHLLEIAANLHARIDVQWSAIDSQPAPAEINLDSSMPIESTMQLGAPRGL